MWWFLIWPTCNVICVGSNFGHQMALLCHQVAPRALPHCIALIALLTLSVGIDLVSSSARVTSVKFQQGVWRTDRQTSGPKNRTPGLPGSDKNYDNKMRRLKSSSPKLYFTYDIYESIVSRNRPNIETRNMRPLFAKVCWESRKTIIYLIIICISRYILMKTHHIDQIYKA